MEGSSRNGEASYPLLLNLIPKEKELHVKMDQGKNLGYSSEEKKLELRLGPPGEDWSFKGNNNRDSDVAVLSLGFSGNKAQKFTSFENPVGNLGLSSAAWSAQQGKKGHPSFLQQFPSTGPQGLHVVSKESSQPCSTKAVDLQQTTEKKAFSTSSAGNTAVPSGSSQKRTAPAPVVGWPPIRSFRKNLATGNSSKQSPESQNANLAKDASKKPMETCKKGMFVKINMDGVPIGRKVDLKASDSYEKLSSAVDELFRGLLAAQRDSSTGGTSQSNPEEGKPLTGLLDGSGEYTLVYEDNEGDKMLLGDVPWHMFVPTVKRLRVLKTSEVSRLSSNSKQVKIATRR